MRRLILLAIAVVALTVVGTASGKGPIAATIDGPGTGGGITLGGGGDAPAWIGTLAQEAGFFRAAFGQSPDSMLAGRPKGDLGARYTITYRVPGPDGSEDSIRQDLYPYAKSGPVTYTPPWQRFFGSNLTRGGWYQAPPALKDTLVRAGLPRTAPGVVSGTDGGIGFTDFWPAFAVVFALVLAALGALLVRRRPRTATT